MGKIGDYAAFPVHSDMEHESICGMSYRQWLVGMAMQGIAANDCSTEWAWKEIAMHAVDAADAVLAELEKQCPPSTRSQSAG